MKRVIVTRRIKFAGALVPFWIVAAGVVEEAPERFQTVEKVRIYFTGHAIPVTSVGWLENHGVQIVSGETVTVNVPDDSDAVYAVTMDGILSNRAMLTRKDADCDGFRLTLTTRGGFLRPGYPWFLSEKL